MKVTACGLAAFFLLVAPAVPARELKVAFGQEKAPYLWTENGHVTGIEYDIVRAALAVSGEGLTAATLPNRRVSLALGGGDYDVVTGMQMNQAGDAFYSDEYLTYANFAITRASSGIRLHGLADLLSHRVAIWQNAWEDLGLGRLRPQGPVGLDYTEFTSQYRQSKFFWVGRADVNVIDKNIFLWYSRILAKQVNTTDPVEFQNILPAVRVRAAFRDERQRDAFDAGLRAIRANGNYDLIFKKYGLVNPDRTS